MATGHPHVGDVHTIRVTVTSDGSTPVILVGPVTFRLQRPDGTTVDVTATLTTTGVDGRAEYLTSTSDLDQAGAWKVQVKDAHGPWHADVVTFVVRENLPTPA